MREDFTYNLLPEELKKEPRFVFWKLVENKGKIPINAKTNQLAKSNDQSTWATFNECLSSPYINYVDGIGFMLGDGYVGIDLDNHDNSNMRDIFNDFYKAFKDIAYIEYSQSRKGIHLILKGKLPNGARHKGNYEMYDTNRYFALTGFKVNKKPITFKENNELLKEYHDKYLGKSKEFVFERINEVGEIEKTNIYTLNYDSVIDKALKTDLKFAELYAGHFQNEYPSQSEADLALTCKLAYYLDKDISAIDDYFKRSALYREKWERKGNDNVPSYKERTISHALSLVKETYSEKKAKLNSEENKLYTENLPLNTKTYTLDDSGNAERFYDTYKNLVRFNYENNIWMIFNGKVWEEDKEEKIKILADKLISQMKKELSKITKEENKELYLASIKNIKRVSNTAGKDAMLKEAKHLLPTKNSDFDKEPYLFVCDNGVINLKEKKMYSFNMIDHTQEMLSRNSPITFDPNATCPLFMGFLNDIFFQDTELIEYLQVALGYSLTAETKEQCMFQCVGSGGNGKGVLFNVLDDILGTYATTIQIETLLYKQTNGGAQASPDLARLSGARWVKTSEPSEGQKFNEGLVKQITGEDKISARFLYGTIFEFLPKFKIWIMANNRIIIRGRDDGIWRRMRIIEFNRKFNEAEQDKDLKYKLQKEYSGILNWLIEGAYKYYQYGIKTPKKVAVATEDYKKEMDVLSQFLEEEIVFTKNEKDKISATKLYETYSLWATKGKEYFMSKTKFGIEASKKLEKKRSASNMYYVGIKLKKECFIYDKQ